MAGSPLQRLLVLKAICKHCPLGSPESKAQSQQQSRERLQTQNIGIEAN
jgi:hypothetical protein